MSLALARAATPDPATPAPLPDAVTQLTNGTFSVISPAQLAPWQERLTLGPADVLSISIYEQPDSAKAGIVIGPDGRLNYLQARDVLASGLTVDELRDSLQNALLKFYRPPLRVVVIPQAYNSKKYFMLGNVVQKGVFRLDTPVTLLEAIARAQGFVNGTPGDSSTALVDLSRSFIMRRQSPLSPVGESLTPSLPLLPTTSERQSQIANQNSQIPNPSAINHQPSTSSAPNSSLVIGHSSLPFARLPVDFEGLFTRGDLSQNVALAPDDYVYLPPATAREVYVLGEVANRGPTPFRTGLTVMGALASHGGFTDRSYRKRVMIVRGSLSHPQAYAVDVADMLKAKSLDFRLEPGDIVYVSRKPWYKVEELLEAAVSDFMRAAVITYTGDNIGPWITEPIIK